MHIKGNNKHSQLIDCKYVKTTNNLQDFFVSGAHASNNTSAAVQAEPGVTYVTGDHDKTNNTKSTDHIIIYWRKLSSFG